MKYFVVSDVHGFYSILMNTLKNNGFDINNPNHSLIVCGDLFDRGHETIELFNFVKSLPEERFVYIKGNHEDLLFDCFYEMSQGFTPSRHHISNGTVDTIMRICGYKDGYLDYWIADRKKLSQQISERAEPLLQFIRNRAIDYFAVNEYIFVHGYIPCICEDNYGMHKSVSYDTDWKDTTNKTKWDEARWLNGMDCWKQGVSIPGKTIVVGHYHCSWGWSHLKHKYKEYPSPSHEDFNKSFKPFIDDGIIAIDACTAYSKQMNCLVIDA